jgi:hypothetical protein
MLYEFGGISLKLKNLREKPGVLVFNSMQMLGGVTDF